MTRPMVVEGNEEGASCRPFERALFTRNEIGNEFVGGDYRPLFLWRVEPGARRREADYGSLPALV